MDANKSGEIELFCRGVDKSVVENSFTPGEINSLIQEAKNDGPKKKES